MADVATIAPDTTPAASAPDPGATPPSPSVATPDTSAPVTADDTVAKVTRIWDTLAGDSSSSTPAKPPSPAQAATAPDGTTAVSQVPATDKGPIPFPDHQRVVSNTRTKTRTDVLTEYGIADAKPTEVKSGVQFVRLLNDNPKLLIQVLQAQLGGESAAAAPADPDPEPQPDLDLGNGEFAFSAKRHKELLAWERRQITADVNKKFGPLLDAHQHSEATRLGHENATHVVTTATQQWPLFDRLRPQIVEQLKALPDNAGLDPATFFGIYQRVYTAHAPALMRADLERERASEVALKTRGSSARPSAAQPVTPRTGKLSTRDRIAQLWDRAEAAAR